MRVVSFSEFRKNLVQTLDSINADKEVIAVSLAKGKSVVVIDLDEYNSLQETLYLIGTKNNRKRLEEAIAEMNARKDEH